MTMCCNLLVFPLHNSSAENLRAQTVHVYAPSDQSPFFYQKDAGACGDMRFITIQTWRLETIQQAQWMHLPECFLPLSLSLKHRFDVLTTAHLTHYSKCQLCKWSTACLSSHIRWVIALWQAYLFWCSLPTSMVYPSDQYDLADRLKSSSYNFHILQL